MSDESIIAICIAAVLIFEAITDCIKNIYTNKNRKDDE